MTPAPRSLVQRIALVSALGFVLSGAVVAVTTGVLTNRLSLRQEDDHLTEAAGTLAFELRAQGAEPSAVVADEQRELSHSGIQVAVRAGSRHLAGSRQFAGTTGKACVDQGTFRVCSARAGALTAMAARDLTLLREHQATTTRAAWLAVLLTSLLAAGVAHRIARTLVAPLQHLEHALQTVPDHDPGAADLGPSVGVREVDALRASLQSAFVRLGAALDHSRRFASDAAHQLRTPLTAILGELDLALEGSQSGNHDEILRARRVAQRLSVLIDRLLILAQPQATPPAQREVDVLDVVEEAIDTLPSASRTRITCTGPSGVVLGDLSLLTSAVSNALENALKFSEGAVRVVLECDADHVKLHIDDDGPGVPPTEQSLVFEPFYRGRMEGKRQVAGHGIGLSVVAHVIALHGGKVGFADRAHGARLTMSLSRANLSAATAKSEGTA